MQGGFSPLQQLSVPRSGCRPGRTAHPSLIIVRPPSPSGLTGRVGVHQIRVAGRNNRSVSSVPYHVCRCRKMAGRAGDGRRRSARVGRLLRKSRLTNCRRSSTCHGEMSLVGLRPERPEFIELQEQIPFYRTRLMVKPASQAGPRFNIVRQHNGGCPHQVATRFYYIQYWSSDRFYIFTYCRRDVRLGR